MRSIFFIIFFFSIFTARTQDFNWWANSVKWDGVSHWSRYMITQPAFLGPNALSIPRIGNGSTDSINSLAVTANLHFSKGDNTQNAALYANYCLVKDRISFDISWVPYEHFTMSHDVKTQRHVFSQFYYDHYAVGDVWLNTNIQVLNKWRDKVRLAVRIGYRFPAGTGFGLARTSDGPGYHFDVSYGKPVSATLTWVGMAGFYTWQIVSDRHRQDDALLFGNGLEWKKRTVTIHAGIAGYLGYLEKSGDKPIVARLSFNKRLGNCTLVTGFQQGLKNFKYSSVEFGTRYNFK